MSTVPVIEETGRRVTVASKFGASLDNTVISFFFFFKKWKQGWLNN